MLYFQYWAHYMRRDNCTGQNKVSMFGLFGSSLTLWQLPFDSLYILFENDYVLRLASFLVEYGCFKNVSFCFYIVGHTKNICDRMFNSLKKNYRRSNLYNMEQVTDCFSNVNTKITVYHTSMWWKYYRVSGYIYVSIVRTYHMSSYPFFGDVLLL